MNPRRIAVYLPAFAKGYLRNPVGLFFSLIFPIILVLIFGAVFSNSGSTQVPVYVQDLDHNSPASQAFVSALNSTGALSVTMVSPSAGDLSKWLSDHGDDAGIVIPADFGARLANHTPVAVTVYTNPSAGSVGGIVNGAVQGVTNGINLHLANGSPVVSSTSVPLGSATYHSIDYLVPGLIGFSILVSPMFSMVNISSTWKREKLFRQLSLTPLTRSEWLVSALLWYITLSLVSAVLLVGVGKALFGAHVNLTWTMAPFLFIGPAMFVSLGLLLGTISSTPETAAVIGNIVTFPMMFLSGTFFPVSLFPSWLVPVAHALPLFYVIDGLNAGMLFNNPAGALRDVAIVLGLAIVFFIAAIYLFSWRED
jgi:ABC-2 type transport system permease protein